MIISKRIVLLILLTRISFLLGSSLSEFCPELLPQIRKLGSDAQRASRDSTMISDDNILKGLGAKKWTRSDSCWLIGQLICTELIGGFNPYCDTHEKNRNFQEALRRSGNLRITEEASIVLGKLLMKHDYSHYYNESLIVEYMKNKDPNVELNKEKQNMISDIRSIGLSKFNILLSNQWITSLFSGLSNSKFKQRPKIHISNPNTIHGINPDQAAKNGWSGSFWLHDQNEVLAIKTVQQLAYDPYILDIMQDLLGAPPIIRSVDVTFAVAESKQRHFKPSSRHNDKDKGVFSFTTWHKDFNCVKSIKLFVYLFNVGDENGPHTYIPHTQNDMGPRHVTSTFLNGFDAQMIPEEELFHYLNETRKGRRKLSDGKTDSGGGGWLLKQLKGPAGIVWIEDTHIFHKADLTNQGYRGLFQVDYMASGYCGKDHGDVYQVLDKLPHKQSTQVTATVDVHHLSPRLFQRMKVGFYGQPQIAPQVSPNYCAISLEDQFGPLLYNNLDKKITNRNHVIPTPPSASKVVLKSGHNQTEVKNHIYEWQHERAAELETLSEHSRLIATKTLGYGQLARQGNLVDKHGRHAVLGAPVVGKQALVSQANNAAWAMYAYGEVWIHASLVMCYGLRERLDTPYDIIVMTNVKSEISPNHQKSFKQLRVILYEVSHEHHIKTPETSHYFIDVYDKLQAFRLMTYRRIVMIDVDIYITDPLHSLFSMRLEPLQFVVSGAPNQCQNLAAHNDYLVSGNVVSPGFSLPVFAFDPNIEVYDIILAMLANQTWVEQETITNEQVLLNALIRSGLLQKPIILDYPFKMMQRECKCAYANNLGRSLRPSVFTYGGVAFKPWNYPVRWVPPPPRAELENTTDFSSPPPTLTFESLCLNQDFSDWGKHGHCEKEIFCFWAQEHRNMMTDRRLRFAGRRGFHRVASQCEAIPEAVKWLCDKPSEHPVESVSYAAIAAASSVGSVKMSKMRQRARISAGHKKQALENL